MKNFFLIIFCILSFGILQTQAADMLDVDYNFIDTAFDGIKPVSDKQFNDTMNKLTPEPVPDTFLGKLRTFLFGRKYGVNNQTNIKQDEDFSPVDEKATIKELQNGIFYIKLLASIITPDGTIIPLGNYKIQQETINDNNMLVFYQGNKMYGKLKLNNFEDNLKKENEISYSRVDILTPDVIRIVYSTISETKCALAKVYLQNGI